MHPVPINRWTVSRHCSRDPIITDTSRLNYCFPPRRRYNLLKYYVLILVYSYNKTYEYILYFIFHFSLFVVLQIWSRRWNLRDTLLMTFVRSSLNPWRDNASADEGHLYLTSSCCLVLNSKHLRTSPQQITN